MEEIPMVVELTRIIWKSTFFMQDTCAYMYEYYRTDIRRGTIDSLVRFSADSTLIDPTKEKISLWPFIFYCLPTQSYLWNYWSHKNRSPIKIYRFSWGNQPKSS